MKETIVRSFELQDMRVSLVRDAELFYNVRVKTRGSAEYYLACRDTDYKHASAHYDQCCEVVRGGHA